MASYVKGLDPNHLVTVYITAGLDAIQGGDWLDVLKAPSLDFVYAEDADMRVLNSFWPHSELAYSRRFLSLDQPVVMQVTFTSGEWQRDLICSDCAWQSQTIGQASNRTLFRVGDNWGDVLFLRGADLYKPLPGCDACFVNTASNTPIAQMPRNAAARYNPQGMPTTPLQPVRIRR